MTDALHDRIRALEAERDLLSASLRQADALNVTLASKLHDTHAELEACASKIREVTERTRRALVELRTGPVEVKR